MKTEITRFCAACVKSLAPLPDTLATAATALEGSPDAEPLRAPLAGLNDIRARLRSLSEKLSNQQAYLLIFGPLKSGKSTLMNAISGAYVSEVTSLPGYPCLVYVQHAERANFSVTRYNGRESVFANSMVLKDVIADSHVALAQQIRATEQTGVEFSPGHHFPEAIRRVDVKVPVASLAESSTVLVDTPGLYSRMNFGYDVLTREFRDSAACAVFVVKTDNLFLEQVFAEFNQLLDLFSRIFLVINVDSSKRDLHPDGSLQRSAESEDPKRIIDAFKTLSMAGPLRKAYENQRLRLHAVDLLSAASSVLAPGPNGANGQRAAFDEFLTDLTSYLNSSDYLVEFMRDSLRQGTTLCTEAREIVGGPAFAALRTEQEALAAEVAAIDEKIAAIDRLLIVDWDAAFEKVRAENAARIESILRTRTTQLQQELRGALDRWYASPASIKSLASESWNPLVTAAAGELAEDTRRRLRNALDAVFAGAEPGAAAVTDLNAIGLQIRPIGQTALARVSEPDLADPYLLPLAADEIPVQKSFVDYLLFRGQATVRRRLFGEDLTAEIAPEQKNKRLREPSRTALEKLAEDGLALRFPKLPAIYATERLQAYIADFRTGLTEALRARRADFEKDRTARQQPFEINRAILTAVDAVQTRATQVAADLAQLAHEEKVAVPSPAAVSLPESPAVAAGTLPATLEPTATPEPALA